MKEIFKSIMAGVSIGIAGLLYLRVGGLEGAVLFSVGLILVITQGLWLFTGKAYQINTSNIAQLVIILLCNIIGCCLVTISYSTALITMKAEALVSGRLLSSSWDNLVCAIGCGYLMTAAVKGAANKNWLPLLFGVPAFILCAMPHCVADAFYILSCSTDYFWANSTDIACFYICIVFGNLVGCNLYRLTT